MDSRAYKDILTKSGHTYHTFVSPPKDASKPTLLFIHGFPSTSYDWRHQVAFFTKAGYGVVAPDLIGHGGSSKPPSLEHYAPSRIAADLVAVLDNVKAGRVVAVGHDWGSILASRMAMYYPTRFSGLVFLASGYCPPLAGFDLKVVLAHQREHVGAELFGYWLFLSEDRAKGIVDAHLESLLSLWYTSDPGLWKTVLAPSGQLEPWLKADKKAPLASYITKEDETRMLADWRKAGGLGAALKWYKVMASDLMGKDDIAVDGKFQLDAPVFFAGCTRDHVCIAAPSENIVRQFCPKGTVQHFDTGHWVHLEVPEKLNRALLQWLETAVGK
ncbi:alpha/beta-hydrolase [Polyporus arcularius HHB13444]|uniref:Alpha/beta-hydrolase n=1 Tax=Polyporus arcularius HHB13444 TaxID=1314778 RepID=A0A5C3PUW7_9APHY|nr:alpha/beta-hydrolase [Polyporus arcularius HHB13444]